MELWNYGSTAEINYQVSTFHYELSTHTIFT